MMLWLGWPIGNAAALLLVPAGFNVGPELQRRGFERRVAGQLEGPQTSQRLPLHVVVKLVEVSVAVFGFGAHLELLGLG